MREWFPKAGRASLTASPSRTTKASRRALETLSHWTRERSRIVFVFRDRRGIGDSLTRRWPAERTRRDSAEMFGNVSRYQERVRRFIFIISGRGFGVLVPLRACTTAIPSAPDVDDVRLSLHVHGQPRGVGLWPRCHRRAHGSRRGEQGRRRRKQRVLPREGVRQDDDEVVARGCVPRPSRRRTRNPERAATRPRARRDRTKRPRRLRTRRGPRARLRASTARRTPAVRPAGVGKKRRVAPRGFFSSLRSAFVRDAHNLILFRAR